MSAPVISPEEIDTDEPELVHLVCECDEETALCGLEVPGEDWVGGGVPLELYCLVCWDLMVTPCARCGRAWLTS